MFNHQKTLAHQLLVKLQDQLLASQLVLSALLDEFSNTDIIYESYRCTIQSTVQLLKTDSENVSPPKSPQSKRSLLHLLEDALKWPIGTVTTRPTWDIKQCVNQLIQAQTKQQETLVRVVSVLSVTRYAADVNTQKLNEIINALQGSNEDLNRLFKIKEVLTQCIRYQLMYIYMCTILAYL